MTPSDQNSSNFIALLWRGEYSLGFSYWIVGFLVSVAAAIVIHVVSTLVDLFTEYNPAVMLATLLAIWLGVGVIAIWQLVGVWRSADNHMDRRIRAGRKRGVWGRLAKAAVILGALRLALALVLSGVPQIVEASKIALFGDPDLPDYEIVLLADGTEVQVVGGFKYGLNNDLLQILQAAPDVKVIQLDSIGGRIGEALKVNQTIRDHGLVTYVANACMSACTIAFAAGAERWIAADGRLGFHASTFPGVGAEELEESAVIERDAFAASGFDPAFIARAQATPNDDMWIPTSIELQRANVIMGVASAGQFAASELMPSDPSLKPTEEERDGFVGDCAYGCEGDGGDPALCVTYCGCVLTQIYATELYVSEQLAPEQSALLDATMEQCASETARQDYLEYCVPYCDRQGGETAECNTYCTCMFEGVYGTDLYSVTEEAMTVSQRERESDLSGQCVAESLFQ